MLAAFPTTACTARTPLLAQQQVLPTFDYCLLDMLQEAMTAGHSFHLSTNGVLLCEGPLPISLMEEVQLTELPDAWQQPFATTLTTAAKADVMAQNKQSSTNAQAPDTEVEP